MDKIIKQLRAIELFIKILRKIWQN